MKLALPTQKQMQFAPVVEDDDELSQAIKQDPVVQEDNWKLRRDDIDAEELDAFWDQTLREIGPEAPEDTR